MSECVRLAGWSRSIGIFVRQARESLGRWVTGLFVTYVCICIIILYILRYRLLDLLKFVDYVVINLICNSASKFVT